MTNQTWDYGDLRVTMTSEYGWNWDDTGSGASRSVQVYTPSPQGDLRPLGSVAIGTGFNVPSGKRATMLFGNKPGSSGRAAVASPVRYDQIWIDKGSGGKHEGSFWRPIPPSGYVAVGDVCAYKWGTPSLNAVYCLRSDLVRDGQYDQNSIWDDKKSGSDRDCSLWGVKPLALGGSGSEKLPIYADTFRANASHSRPDVGLAVVPTLYIPKNYARYEVSLPRVTANAIPHQGDTFDSREQCRVTLPLAALYGPTDQKVLDNIRKPFCTVVRSTAWNVEGVWTNRTGGNFKRSESIKYGITKEQRTEMVHSVGIEVSAEAGFKGVGYSVSLNYQFTYSTSSTFTEFYERTVTEEFDVPSYHATVLFSKHVWLTASRPDGTTLSRVEITANDDTHFSGCALPH
ncbi:hypothetical protein HIM_02834 [Hirsutella minnesotensis 3608]|nr:hypothetical protein HIM_02834 [Hirsutella minnesotensis 3608]